MNLCFPLASVLLAVCTLVASAQWQLLTRKDGADVERFYTNTGGTIFARLSGTSTIFRSHDGGISWMQLDIPSAPATASFASCTDSLGIESMVLAANGTFHRSTDGGFSWQEIPIPTGIALNETVASIEGLRFGDLVVITTGTSSASVYVSNDNAVSAKLIGTLPAERWQFYQAHDSTIYCFGAGLYKLDRRTRNIIMLASGSFTALTSSQEYSGAPVILWAIRNGSLARSTDGGSSWTEVSTGLPTLPANARIAIVRQETMFCFVPSATSDSTAIYRRYLGSMQWTLVSRQSFTVRDVAVTLSSTLLVATADGIFSAEDSGMFWSNSSSGIAGVALECAVYHPNIVLIAASSSGKLFRSVNAGLSWTTVAPFGSNSRITDALVIPPNLVVLAASSGLWCSNDGGMTVSRCSTASGSITDPIVAVCAFKGMLAAASATTAYISTDGMNWLSAQVPIATGETIVGVRANDSLAIVATTHSIVAVERLVPLSLRTIASIVHRIIHCDIATDGTVICIADSNGTSIVYRYRSDGTPEAQITLPPGSVRSLALSRGGTCWIAFDGKNTLTTIRRTSVMVSMDSSITEPVLYLRRQANDELLATTSRGGVYRLVADSILSVQNEFAADAITIFPNPVTSHVTISAARIPIDAVSVYDMLGRLLFEHINSTPEQAIAVQIGSLAAGSYVLRLKTAGGDVIRLLMIR
ncbi:MAG: T9SS type A sorting domain-containing protein [Chlorobi bacterium]|nr:T9SS type A sorting domain-containing protein [Chlorobiota bacterium]